MIAHVSIPAEQPERVALLLGKIADGSVYRFPVVDGAYIVVANDGSGTAFEVYPAGMAHHPGVGNAPTGAVPPTPRPQVWEDQIYFEATPARPSSHHMAITTRLSVDEVVELGKGLGFRALLCDRAGFFKLVELWIDNLYLIEVLPAREAERYRGFMKPDIAAEFFGAPIEAGAHAQ